jgi:hypothetical protein
MDEEIAELLNMNTTELLSIARDLELGILSRSLPRERLAALVAGAVEVTEDDICSTLELRKKTSKFIHRYRDRVLLPTSIGGKPCDGNCPTYGCPSVIAVKCAGDLAR